MSAVGTTRAVLARAREAEVTFLGAAIAYYALVSVVPALLLATALAGSVGGAALADRVVDAAGGLLTPAGQGAVEDALTGAAGRVGASAVGLVVLLWSTLKVFRGLDIAFSRVYGTTRTVSLAERLRDAGVGLVSIGAGIGAMLVLGATFATLSLPVAGWVLGLLGLTVGLFVAFLPLYYVFPDTRVPLAEAAPGAVLAAVGWVGLQAAFQVYAALASFELYGVLGGVLLLVTWFYAGAALLLVGAALNVVVADRQREKAAGRGG